MWNSVVTLFHTVFPVPPSMLPSSFWSVCTSPLELPDLAFMVYLWLGSILETSMNVLPSDREPSFFPCLLSLTLTYCPTSFKQTISFGLIVLKKRSVLYLLKSPQVKELHLQFKRERGCFWERQRQVDDRTLKKKLSCHCRQSEAGPEGLKFLSQVLLDCEDNEGVSVPIVGKRVSFHNLGTRIF